MIVCSNKKHALPYNRYT